METQKITEEEVFLIIEEEKQKAQGVRMKDPVRRVILLLSFLLFLLFLGVRYLTTFTWDPALDMTTERYTLEGDYLSGHWEDCVLSTPSGPRYGSGYFLDQRLLGCTGFTVDVEITMNANSRCRSWDVMVRSGERFTRVGTLILEDGNGAGSSVVELIDSTDIEAVAVYPTSVGSYSWSIALGVKDVVSAG